MEENNKPAISNVRIFYNIAKESFEQMNQLFEAGRRPKPNDEPGWIFTFDPDQKSFKAAFVTIIFSGIYLEALLHLLIVERKGLSVYIESDKRRDTYAKKLKLLDCKEQFILEDSEHLRIVRNEIVHEKAHQDSGKQRTAQDEATRAFNLIEAIRKYFDIQG